MLGEWKECWNGNAEYVTRIRGVREQIADKKCESMLSRYDHSRMIYLAAANDKKPANSDTATIHDTLKEITTAYN